MKNINIRFVGTGYNNFYWVKVKIYDKCDKLIYKVCIYNGRITVCLKENNCYKLVMSLNN